jgi:hypothetical protein
VRQLSSNQKEPGNDELPPPPEETPPPPPPEEEKAEVGSSDAWKESYEDLVEPEEAPKPAKKRFRHWGAVVVTVIVIVILLAWTLASPPVMDEVGDTYVRHESAYAEWGNYTGYTKTYAGNTTWGVSLSGHFTSAGNRSLELDVLITKVSEMVSNGLFIGTAIDIRNVSAFLDDGTFLASMANETDLGFGRLARIPISFSDVGSQSVYVTVKFVVYGDMRIGFIPSRAVTVQKVYMDVPVEVE